jgi:hypothetical protein
MVHNYLPFAAKSASAQMPLFLLSQKSIVFAWWMIFSVKKLERTEKIMFIIHLVTPYLNISYKAA